MKLFHNVNIKSFLLFIVFIGVIFLLGIVLTRLFIYLVNIYVKRNRDRLFQQNSEIAQRSRDLGHELLNKMDTYCQYIDELGLDQEYECSSSIVSNASKNTIKHLIKYSNIENSVYSLERIDFCIDYLQSLIKFQMDIKCLHRSIRDQLSVLIRMFAQSEKIPYIVCDVDYKLANVRKPVFCFLYVSPAGNSHRTCRIRITLSVLRDVRAEVCSKISKGGHSKIERSNMTSDLREAIKKRDNYTCCICGNSIYKEPNLLLEVDHIIPVSKGGKTVANNLQTLCWRCNRKKGNNL